MPLSLKVWGCMRDTISCGQPIRPLLWRLSGRCALKCVREAQPQRFGNPVAQEERSRAISFIFSGLQVGSLAGLLVAPPLIEQFGWEVVFYIFGVTGTRSRSRREQSAV